MRSAKRRTEGGSALLVVLVITVLIVGLAGAYLALTSTSSTLTAREVMGLHALYCAETGAAVVISSINADQIQVVWPTVAMGQAAAQNGLKPEDLPALLTGSFGTGTYNVTLALWGYDGLDNNGDGAADDPAEVNYITLTARGDVSGEVRQVECILSRSTGSLFKNALYSGNASGDADYGLTLKGTGPNADSIDGDVYVNGDFALTEEASLNNGQVMVTPGNTVSGFGNWTQGVQDPYDMQAKRYNEIAHVKVTNNFDAGIAAGTARYSPGRPPGRTRAAGGSAWQLPDTDPAHIFRKNPSDRTLETAATPGDDFFLEDPYETLRSDRSWDGTDAAHISLTPGYTDNTIYYLGKPNENTNMWIHNLSSYGFKLNTPSASANGSKTLIVVKGDIYISDNLHYLNKNKDIMVFIALKNEDGTGGNIYLGDPRYGTVEKFNCMMYAENNFVVTNISTGNANAPNSKIVVYGNMAAGNQLIGNLDQGGAHHRLEVTLDPRIRDGTLPEFEALLPENPGAPPGDYGIASWRSVPPRQEAATKGPQM